MFGHQQCITIHSSLFMLFFLHLFISLQIQLKSRKKRKEGKKRRNQFQVAFYCSTRRVSRSFSLTLLFSMPIYDVVVFLKSRIKKYAKWSRGLQIAENFVLSQGLRKKSITDPKNEAFSSKWFIGLAFSCPSQQPRKSSHLMDK